MSYGVGHRHSSDLALLWLWYWQVAVAPIQPLAWELPYATLKSKIKKERERDKDLYSENYKTLIKESKDDTNRWKYTMLLV